MQSLANINERLNSTLLNNFTILGLNHVWSLTLALCTMLLTVVIASALSYYVSKFALLRSSERLSHRHSMIWLKIARDKNVFDRTALLLPGIVVYASGYIIDLDNFDFLHKSANLIHILASMYLIIVASLIISSLLDTFEIVIKNISFVKVRPVKSYIQITKLVLYLFSGILIISVILNKSPMYLLTGLGAMTAVMMLVFKDSILGFVASIQLAAYDMVRIGDWIELTSYGANGDVIDISLNTVKVQNFDKTIVTVPSYALLTNGVINWRGMSESGGRRIKRSINFNVSSIKFADDALISKLKRIALFKPFIEKKLQEINEHNKKIEASDYFGLNGRALTNIGLFRSYLEIYLTEHPKIHNGLTFLVRQLQEQGQGVPIELYVFTNDTNWNNYEGIQADIFDHIYAVAPYFDLEIFQYMSGKSLDVRYHAAH